MKSSEGFDARRLRPKGSGNWGSRFSALFAFVFFVCGLALIAAGVASLVSHPAQLGDLNNSPVAGGSISVLGLFVALVGRAIRRRTQRRIRQSGELALSPRLMKKH